MSSTISLDRAASPFVAGARTVRPRIADDKEMLRAAAELTRDAFAARGRLGEAGLVEGTLWQRVSGEAGDPALSPDGARLAVYVDGPDDGPAVVLAHGWTLTAAVWDPAVEARLAARVPINRLGTVDEIAAAVVYLCSDAAAFMVGHAMVLDGGITAA